MNKRIIGILVILILAIGLFCTFFVANIATATTIEESEIDEISIANEIETVQANEIQEQIKIAKELKIKKNKTIKLINKSYKKYKICLSSNQKKNWKKYKKNIYKAESKEQITRIYNKIKKIIKKEKKHYNYIIKWTKRINNYLSGSPTARCGKYYAEAAWQNNIDPRWAPAISCVESGKGSAYIHGTYNIWGWGCGNISLGSSWKTAIYNYVAKLKAGYGSALTMWAACKYCSSEWYSVCANEISKI